MSDVELDRPEVSALLDRAEEEGAMPLSRLEEVAEELDLDDEATERLYAEARSRRIAIRDDVGREEDETPAFTPEELAAPTVDALTLFLNEAGRYALLTAAEEVAWRSGSSAAMPPRRS